MSTFGEDLRTARMSRGIALEDITAVTKISLHHLQALEQERFRQLPGGILNKGIVRGYATAVGLEPQAWTDRFLKAYEASGQVLDDDRDWMAFASNVGKARMQRREAIQFRLRWIGVFFLVLMVGAGVFLAFRYYGMRAGWWPTVIPENHVAASLHIAYVSTVQWVERLLA
jgi:cytoskeletal protein RodZ